MKKIFFTLLLCVGFCAGAEQLQGSVSQPDTASGTDTSVFQMSEVVVDKSKRNGFVSSKFGIVYPPDLNKFIFVIKTSYGEVVGKSDIAPAGTFEATTSITGAFSGGSSVILMSGSTEINFMKNDGMNKLVPGLSISVSLGYVDNSSAGGYTASIGGGVYLKAFVSKQFALVPHLEVAYVRGGADDVGTGSGLLLGGGVGLRRYF